MFFGGGQHNAEEDVYDYDFSSAGNFKTKSYKGESEAAKASGSIPPFSPIPKAGKPIVSFSDQQKGLSSQAAGGGDSALERAKNIMDRYSGKQAKPAPFKARPISFNEDDLSMSGEDDEETEENSDVNMSESYAASDSFVEKPQKQKATVPPPLKATTSNAKPAAPVPSTSAAPAAKHLAESTEEEQSGYSDEEFDNDGEELEESLAHDDDNENTSYSRIGYGNDDEEDEEEDDAVEEVASMSASQTSKSKILSFADFAAQPAWDGSLGESVDVHEDESPSPLPAAARVGLPTATSKPSSTQASAALSSAPSVSTSHSVPRPAPQAPPPSDPTALPTTSSAPAQRALPPAKSSPPTAPAPVPATIPVTTPPTLSAGEPSMRTAYVPPYQPYQAPPPPAAAPTTDSTPQPAPQPASVPASIPASVPTPAAYPWPPSGVPPSMPPPPPPYAPGAYPWAAPGGAAWPAYPPPAPYGYPTPATYPYPPPPPPPLPPFPYGHALPDVYAPYAHMWYTSLAAQTLPAQSSIRLSADTGGKTPPPPLLSRPPPPVQRRTASLVPGPPSPAADPAVMELVMELQRVQEEANWAKKQLAETIVKLQDREKEAARGKAAPSRSLPEASSGPVRALAPRPGASAPSSGGRYGQAASTSQSEEQSESYAAEEVEDEEDDDEYSEDFEVSKFSVSTPVPTHAAKPLKTVEEESGSDPSPHHSPPSSQVPAPVFSHDPMDRRAVRHATRMPSSHSTESALYHPDGSPYSGYGCLPQGSFAPMDPFTSSIAQSFLASQELLRAKLDSLRLRVQMSSSLAADRRHLEDLIVQGNRASSASAPSLHMLKQQFEAKKLTNEQRLSQVLKESYPEMTDQAIASLIKQYQ